MAGIVAQNAQAVAAERVPLGEDPEHPLLSALLAAQDRSSGSVELARHIVDWRTRHHFSHQRTNLLRPLRIGDGQRVLEVGAGSGALTRHLGEQGAAVVALEADPVLAAAARLRCDGLGRVDVREGSLDDLANDERFDIVLLCGALEQAGAPTDEHGGAPALLGRAGSLLCSGGVVVVATANQLALKHLVGAPDDVTGRPWAGVDDYAGAPGPRTWTRRELGEMLSEAGLAHQRWMAPFPDHLVPSVVVDESAYGQPDAAELIEQLVLHPIGALADPPARLADGGAVHGVFLRAGLAFDVASSYLIVAGHAADDVRAIAADDNLAWLFGGVRVDPWRRVRVLTSDRQLVTLGDTETRQVDWLQQDPGSTRPFEVGRTLHQLALAAVRTHDLPALGAVLRGWRDELDARADEVTVEVGATPHPFLLEDTTRALPDGYLDAALSNFVVTDEGPVLIDDEWRTGHPVDLRMARHRALWTFARELVTQKVDHPWGDTASVDDVMGELASLTGIKPDDQILGAMQLAEVELQRLVADEPSERVLSGWFDGSLRTVDLLLGAGTVPGKRGDELHRLATAHAALVEEVDRLTRERDRLDAERAEYLGQSEHLTGVVQALEAQVAYLRRPKGFVADQVRRRLC